MARREVHPGLFLKEANKEGESLLLRFENVEGLKTVRIRDGAHMQEQPDKGVSLMEVKSGEKDFVEVPAIIEGQTVRLDVKGMNPPLAVRYAFRNCPGGNLLFNGADLPASPFLLDAVK